tara:strand:- start:51 stop:491 length:441 start_codon:yes stop_codon:yes gene_type:complete
MIAATLTRAHILHVAKNAPKENDTNIGLVLSSLHMFAAPGRGLAFLGEGNVYAVTGLAPMWDGVAEAWFIPTKDMQKKKIQTIRLVRRELDAAIQRLKLRRVQAAVRSDFAGAHKLAKFLGFESEGLMKKYGPDGLDYERYAKWNL